MATRIRVTTRAELFEKRKQEHIERGYRVHLFFLSVSTVEVALSRIKDLVTKGGHDVPEAIVRRRFDRSFRNFFLEYRDLAHSWYLLDNTSTTPATVAFKKGRKLRINQTKDLPKPCDAIR